jgi:hypothetical protein
MIDAVGSITIKVIGGTPKPEIPWPLIAVVGGAAIVGSAIFLKKKN